MSPKTNTEIAREEIYLDRADVINCLGLTVQDMSGRAMATVRAMQNRLVALLEDQQREGSK